MSSLILSLNHWSNVSVHRGAQSRIPRAYCFFLARAGKAVYTVVAKKMQDAQAAHSMGRVFEFKPLTPVSRVLDATPAPAKPTLRVRTISGKELFSKEYPSHE